ncbi:hypothetical protein ACFVX3_31975 [Rhodococcus erythropolis]
MAWYQIVQVFVLTVVALIGLPAAVYYNYSVRLRRENEVKRLLDIVDKLPEEAPGRRQIKDALGRATLDLAYILEFPRTFRDWVPIAFGAASIGAGTFGLVWTFLRGSWWIVWTALALQVIALFFFNKAGRNSREINELTRQLFVKLEAPEGLKRQTPSLARRVVQPGTIDVLDRMDEIRARDSEKEWTVAELANSAIEELLGLIRSMDAEIRGLKRDVRAQKVVMIQQRMTILFNTWVLARRRRQLGQVLRRLERENPARAAKIRAEYDELMSGVTGPHE